MERVDPLILISIASKLNKSGMVYGKRTPEKQIDKLGERDQGFVRGGGEILVDWTGWITRR